MIRENKELLLKDLCARLPYKVKCYGFQMKIDGNDNECYGILKNISDCYSGCKFILSDRVPLNDRKCYEEAYSEVKPYLYPLSSMTEEQKEELKQRGWYFDCFEIYNVDKHGWREAISHEDCFDLIDWLNKNHFDYRGLIEKSLALDATNLNIY
jgi:hypothetical protein